MHLLHRQLYYNVFTYNIIRTGSSLNDCQNKIVRPQRLWPYAKLKTGHAWW